MSYEQTIPDKVLHVIHKIENERRDLSNVKRLRLPNYHCFTYKGFQCYLICCLSLNERWTGFIRKPQNKRLEWPPRTRERPFGVKIDFELPYNDDSTLIGFHTKHLIHNVSCPGVHERPDIDYVVVELRNYIDHCSI